MIPRQKSAIKLITKIWLTKINADGDSSIVSLALIKVLPSNNEDTAETNIISSSLILGLTYSTSGTSTTLSRTLSLGLI